MNVIPIIIGSTRDINCFLAAETSSHGGTGELQ